MNWGPKFEAALDYDAWLKKYGGAGDRARWERSLANVTISDDQVRLLQSFRRRMNVLCLAGTWCGDCVSQCPILRKFQQAAPQIIDLRFLDSGTNPDVQRELSINGGDRVPVVVFLSEDMYECARFGDRTLSKYREMASMTDGAPACPTGIGGPDESVQQAVIREWLEQFERVQLMLRMSPRLRQKYGD